MSTYTIPNVSVGANLYNTHVPVAFCRGVGSSQNGFFIESFVDELAHAAGQDAVAYRRRLLDKADPVIDYLVVAAARTLAARAPAPEDS